MAQLKVVNKSVNSKILYDEILAFLKEGVYDFGIVWNSEAHRDSFVHVVNDFLFDIAEEGKIEQFKVIGDKRNNKYSDIEQGIYHVDVSYRQRNCLNVTQIMLTIDDNDHAGSDLLDLLGLTP